MIGQSIGSYQVLSKLGEGGMGEVYRARDTKLDRDVAIKVLPESFAADADRVARFTREAKTLASLNHPNIAQIYGIEEFQEKTPDVFSRALVMELVEGRDLSEVIFGGAEAHALHLPDTLAIARQIAGALEAAHEQGIIHRDLKPQNIKVREDGTVKVLDFGLAKAMDPAGASSAEAMNSPTLTNRATQMGMILGTAAYMAPEQAKGKAVDKRADVWAFGVVLYEMLTGRRAFAGDDVSETLASVLKDTPSMASLPDDVPSSIRRLLRRCLEKDRAKRLDSMAVARLEIEEAIAGEPAAAAPIATPPAVPSRRMQPAVIAGLIGVAIVAAGLTWWLKPGAVPAQPTVTRFAVTLPTGMQWTRTGRHLIAISPDGTHVAYVADNQLFVRRLDQFEAVAVASVADPAEVIFSPDGASVAFFTAGKLLKVSLSGGAPQPICESPLPLGASWTGDTIVFGDAKGIYRVPATGGTPELIVTREGSEQLTGPQLLPGGQAVLYTKSNVGSSNDGEIIVEQIGTKSRTVLLRGGMNARYLALDGGYLVYNRSGEILGVPLDLAALTVTGPAVSLLGGVRENVGTGTAHFSISATGALVYVSGSADDNSELVWVDMKGAQKPITSEKGAYQYLRVSPDGTRVAYTAASGSDREIFVLDWARNSKIRLTKEAGSESSPIWSPDNTRIAYSASRTGGQSSIYWRAADGSGEEEQLTTGPNLRVPFSWSTDGQTMFFVEQNPGNSNDIWALPMTGDRTPRALVTSRFDERRPAISPDGRWLAYGTNEPGPPEIHVRPYPETARGQYQASAGGGTSPVWSIDGRAIFYRNGGKYFRVNVTTSPDFKAAKPEELFTLSGSDQQMNYDLAPDGKRFAVIKSGSDSGGAEYHVVVNWIEELRARVRPAK
jgi:eukaryotic-like serine/threonine-protein kinase